MKTTDRLAELIIERRGDGAGRVGLAAEVSRIAASIEERFGIPRLPAPSESVGIALDAPKTAALFFDRLWEPHGCLIRDMPSEIRTYGATDLEIWTMALYQLLGPQAPSFEELAAYMAGSDLGEVFSQLRGPVERDLADHLALRLGVAVSPVYVDIAQRKNQYRPGAREVVILAVTEMRIVDEQSLVWEQVRNFRRDLAVRNKYRRMLHWLDDSMVGRSAEFIADEIALRYDDYKRVLAKHGIQTVVGTLESVLDAKFLAALGAVLGGLTIAGHNEAGMLLTLASLGGKATCSAAKHLIERRDHEQGSSVAFVHEVAKLNR